MSREKPPVGRGNLYLVLAAGMAAVSSAAILISFARGQGIPAIVIAALRMSMAAAVVVPIALLRCRAEIAGLSVKDVLLGIGSGLLLALHFAFWISSLDYTSVMSSVVLVSTNPLFVALASMLLFRERLGVAMALGIGLSVLGGAIVGFADLGQAGTASGKGDIMALLGAVSASGYLLIGRRLRKRMSLTLYVGIAYLVAAVALLSAVGVSGTRLGGYPLQGYLWVGLLAVGPQLLGHTSYNWALRYVSATFLTVTLLVEPVGATLLAIPFLSQVPSPLRLGGGVFILVGIFLAARAEARAARTGS